MAKSNIASVLFFPFTKPYCTLRLEEKSATQLVAVLDCFMVQYNRELRHFPVQRGSTRTFLNEGIPVGTPEVHERSTTIVMNRYSIAGL